jgi:hypothetical protein
VRPMTASETSTKTEVSDPGGKGDSRSSVGEVVLKIAFFLAALIATGGWLWLLGWVALALLGY